MKEATFWTNRLSPNLKLACLGLGLRHHFERVENAVANGTPDVDYCIAGYAGKMELKYRPRDPVRASTPVLGPGNGLRRSQVIWIARRLRAGGTVFLAIGTPLRTWVINLRGWEPEDLPRLEDATVARLGEISAWCANSQPWHTLPATLMERGP